jgi:hypothetical protein
VKAGLRRVELAGACSLLLACGGTATHETSPVITLAPDQFVLRDIRKDAARHLNCQVPNVGVEQGPWAGSEGNVVAMGCGYQLTYYVRCQTNHLCRFDVSD